MIPQTQHVSERTLRHEASTAISDGRIGDAARCYSEICATVRGGVILFGDSHVWSFGLTRSLVPIWLGAVSIQELCHNNDLIELLHTCNRCISAENAVIMSFGEIDARHNIFAQAQKLQCSPEKVCGKLCDNYFETLSTIFGKRKSKLIIATPVPPHEIPPTSVHAFVNAPPLSVRGELSRLLQDEIRQRVKSTDYGLLDLYKLLVVEAGNMPDHLTYNDIHAYATPALHRIAGYATAIVHKTVQSSPDSYVAVNETAVLDNRSIYDLVEEKRHCASQAIHSNDLNAALGFYRQMNLLRPSKAVIIGDSHVFSYLDVKDLLVCWFGPITMFRFGRSESGPIPLEQLQLSTANPLIFSFGDVDVRLHISKLAARQGKSLDDVCTEMVTRYLSALSKLTRHWEKDKIFVATTVPPHQILANSPRGCWDSGFPWLGLRDSSCRWTDSF